MDHSLYTRELQEWLSWCHRLNEVTAVVFQFSPWICELKKSFIFDNFSLLQYSHSYALSMSPPRHNLKKEMKPCSTYAHPLKLIRKSAQLYKIWSPGSPGISNLFLEHKDYNTSLTPKAFQTCICFDKNPAHI